ncbi:MAG TPA: outer membrane protein assembly factor BamA, partial [Longimicrobiales bacterium]|nr:outer membrane protein assembly factor BamA [Longimicrobiales bacterium]
MAAQESFRLSSLQVRGLQRQKLDFIVAQSGLRVGDPIHARDLQRAVRRLFATGLFDDIKPYVIEGDSGRVTVELEVKERPFISTIDFNGLEHIRSSAVMDSADLRPGAPLSPSKVTETEAATRRLLASKGFQLRSFRHRLEPIGQSGEHRLIIDVVEGSRVALSDIQFEGNTLFSDDDLKSALDTKEEGFLWFRPGTYDEEKLRADLREKLPAHYQSEGFLDFAVVSDSIAVDPQTGKARLVIHVEEGPQYRLAEFDVRGNRHFTSDELKRYFEEESGGIFGISFGTTQRVRGDSIFDAVAFASATQRIRQLYSNQGYLYAQIEPRVEKVEGRNAVRVAWEIQEGEPAYINKVTIIGNTFTQEDVIRGQLVTIPGDVYSEELLVQSYQRIGATGFFEMPMPTPKIEPQEDGDVNITFEVKEKQTGSVNFGTAVGGGAGLAGFLGYDQPNLFGKAKSGHLRWEFGRYSNNFEASYSDPAINDSRYSGSLSLFSSRDRWFRFSEGQQRRTGIGVRVGVPLPRDVRSRFSIGYTLARTSYEKFEEEESTSLFSLPPGIQSTVTFSLARQTLDHPMFPTTGTRMELEANFNGGILGGDGDFQKYLVTGNWYVPVGTLGGGAPGSRPVRLTLGLTAESGVLFGDASRFPFQRFWMGGVQFGRPLRGYDETTITPRGYFPRCESNVACIPLEERFGDAFLRLSAEYAIRFTDNISVSAFYDAGGVWREPRDFNPTRLLRGAGVGAMLVTPFGPIGLDYAYGFD